MSASAERIRTPPLGVELLRKAAVKKGQAAVLRGRWLQVLAFLLGAASIAVPPVLGYSLYCLGEG